MVDFIFHCVKTGAKSLTFDTCNLKYMATNLTPEQTKEHKLWHQKYRDPHCEGCHQGRTIFREESGKKKLLVDKGHKQHMADALKNLEEIEQNIRDKEGKATDTITEVPETTTPTTTNIEEDTIMGTINNAKIEVDFSNHKDLLELIAARADNDFRTVDQQILYMVNKQIMIDGEIEP